jgi:hypothetical protein
MRVDKCDRLAISGGGFNAFLFLGGIRYLEERLGVPRLRDHFAEFSGTSIGAILSLALAMGADSAQITRLFHDFDQTTTQPRITIGGVWESKALCPDSGVIIASLIRSVFREYRIPEDETFEGLFRRTGKRLQVTVTSLVHMQAVYLSHETHGEAQVLRSIQASMSLPPVFPPVRIPGILGDIFTDGAVSSAICLNRRPLSRTLFLHLAEGSAETTVEDIMRSPVTYGSRVVRCLLGAYAQRENRRLLPTHRANVILFPRRFAFHLPSEGDAYDATDLIAKGYIWTHAHFMRYIPDQQLELSPQLFDYVIRRRCTLYALVFLTALLICNQ